MAVTIHPQRDELAQGPGRERLQGVDVLVPDGHLLVEGGLQGHEGPRQPPGGVVVGAHLGECGGVGLEPVHEDVEQEVVAGAVVVALRVVEGLPAQLLDDVVGAEDVVPEPVPDGLLRRGPEVRGVGGDERSLDELAGAGLVGGGEHHRLDHALVVGVPVRDQRSWDLGGLAGQQPRVEIVEDRSEVAEVVHLAAEGADGTTGRDAPREQVRTLLGGEGGDEAPLRGPGEVDLAHRSLLVLEDLHQVRHVGQALTHGRAVRAVARGGEGEPEGVDEVGQQRSVGEA